MDNLSEKLKKLNEAGHARRIILVYALLSMLWIVITDFLHMQSFGGQFSEFIASVSKGIFFVIVTSIIFYFLLKKYFSKIDLAARVLDSSDEKLVEKSNYLNAVIEASPYAIFDIDRDGKVVSIWNRAAEKMFGWKESEVIGKFLPIVPTDKLAEFEKTRATAFSGQRIEGLELLRKKRNGENSPLKLYSYPVTEANGAVSRVLAYYEDTTSSKKYEEEISMLLIKAREELREKKSAYDQIRKFSMGIEQSPNSIIITNSKGNIEYINPYFTELTGYTLNDVAGKNPRILQSGKTPADTYKEMWETISSGKVWHGEFLNMKRSGELYWESASIGPIVDENGYTTHYIAIKQDITEKKKQEQLIRESLEEKEIMLKEIHHRVKNNLQVISSLLNMQVEHYKNPEAIDAINSSRNRVKAMALVHENLYRSSNISKTEMSEYINMLSRNIYSAYGVSFERVGFKQNALGINFGIDTVIPLGLIINEVISNSLKHAFLDEKKGRIILDITQNPDESYRLRICDNGVGLPEDFDPEQTRSLGVSLITGLASQLDGTAVMNNTGGTEVIVNFKELKYKSRL
ncbi:MAG: PAS domain S-box protein [Ignavibacteria bacterium]|nr:PAS domain S-box protein [Ignavibacteria bacterium]